jgi:branched-chain amino acid transport system substrate-binding protein
MSKSRERTSPAGLRRRDVLASGAVLVAGLGLPAIVRAADEIAVSAVLPLTGPSAQFGQTSWDSMQLAAELMNEAGGVKSMGGARLKLSIFDTETKPEIAVTQTEQAIQRGASVIMGCNQSAATIVASQVAERNEVPFLTAYDIDPTITARGFKFVFRCSSLTANYSSDILACAKEMREKGTAGATRLGLLSENSVTGQGVNKALIEAAKKFGFEVVNVASYDVGTTQNFAPFIAKMKSDKVEVLIGHNRVSDGIQITRTAKELAFNPAIMGGVLGAPNTREYHETLGRDAENVMGTDSFALSLNVPGLKEVAERVRTQLKRTMDVGVASVVANVGVIWDALERAKSGDRKVLRDAIASTDLKAGERNYFMLRGAKFGPTGDNERAVSIITQIIDGVPVPVWPTEFAQTRAVFPKPGWS